MELQVTLLRISHEFRMGGSLKAAGFGDGRECRMPAKHITCEACDRESGQQGSSNAARTWIPAFAGMTDRIFS
jgi:hypothetical protein